MELELNRDVLGIVMIVASMVYLSCTTPILSVVGSVFKYIGGNLKNRYKSILITWAGLVGLAGCSLMVDKHGIFIHKDCHPYIIEIILVWLGGLFTFLSGVCMVSTNDKSNGGCEVDTAPPPVAPSGYTRPWSPACAGLGGGPREPKIHRETAKALFDRAENYPYEKYYYWS